MAPSGPALKGDIFIDTNLLVAAYDRAKSIKQERAISVLDELVSAGHGIVSTQVLGEFFIAVTQKMKDPLSLRDASKRVERLAQIWPVLDISGLIVLEAFRGVRSHHLNFWDAQIWATARLNQIYVLFSEDAVGDRALEGVRYVNPFAGDFKINDWV